MSHMNIKIKWGYNTYYMRYWLRLLQYSQLCCHYLLPYSMLYLWGIDCNTDVHKTKAKKDMFYLLIIVEVWEREYIRSRTTEIISRYRSISQKWESYSKKKEYICRYKNKV